MNRWLFFLCCLVAGLLPARAGAGALPELRLSFRGGIGVLRREVWTQPVALSVVMPDGREAYRSRRTAVKLHGHSTAAKAKKPMALRLPSAAPLLGMAAGRRWVLLANVMDHSHMRNRLAFAMARLTSLPWTPDSRFVRVTVNGRPQGCYLLAEAVRVAPGRIAVGGRGGFLVELDAYRDAPAGFLTPRRQLPVGVKWPADASPRQLRQIRSFFARVEQQLYGPRADAGRLWGEWLDLTSFADWWIVHELAQNAEPNGPRSCYMYRPAGGRLHAGPVWDFDSAFGVRVNDPSMNSSVGYYFSGEREPWFMASPVVSQRFEEVLRDELLPVLREFLSEDSDALKTFGDIEDQLVGTQRMNQVLWGLTSYSDWIEPAPTYAGNMDYLEGWLRARTSWLEGQAR